jgi:mRNA interferase RelE/StbE
MVRGDGRPEAVQDRVGQHSASGAFGSLAEDPRRRGKPLQRELAGRWSARRGDYRILYRLDEDAKTMYVLRVASRGDAYRT